LNGRGRAESSLVVFAERLCEQAACVCAPREVPIAKSLEGVGLGVEPLDRGRQGLSPHRRIEVSRQLEDRWVVEGRFAMEIPARGKDEEGPAERRIPFRVVERHLLAREVREDDQVDVASRPDTRLQAACSSAIESTSSRIAMPSSISSRVIVSGGQTMITFQCVIR
jgi:hypothetical protein